MLRLGGSNIELGRSIVIDKLGQMAGLDELFDYNFQPKAILGIIVVALVISTVFVPIPLLGQAFHLVQFL